MLLNNKFPCKFGYSELEALKSFSMVQNLGIGIIEARRFSLTFKYSLDLDDQLCIM